MAARPTIVGLGEILWDMFPDGAEFGGAPANFACSVANLGDGQMDSYVVGAVGRDDLGTRALELLRERGVRTDCVAVVDEPTGQVLVHLDSAGQPTYEIATDTAWDNIPWSDELAALAANRTAGAAELLGEGQGEPSHVAHIFPDLAREAERVLAQRTKPRRGRLPLHEAAHCFDEELLIGREIEVHGSPQVPGRLRIALAMTLRWISLLPP